MSVFPELAVIKGLVIQGERIVVPEDRVAGEETTLREWEVDLGHFEYQDVDATKRLLRLRLWFPGMDHEVERGVSPTPGISTTPPQGPSQAQPSSHRTVGQALL